MVNYFAYDYLGRNKSHAPFTTHTALAINPWKPHSHLLRVAIKAYQEPAQALPPANLVFLIDVSGSMRARNKLALLKPALKRLSKQLRAKDVVSIVAYANGAWVVLDSARGLQHQRITNAVTGKSFCAWSKLLMGWPKPTSTT